MKRERELGDNNAEAEVWWLLNEAAHQYDQLAELLTNANAKSPVKVSIADQKAVSKEAEQLASQLRAGAIALKYDIHEENIIAGEAITNMARIFGTVQFPVEAGLDDRLSGTISLASRLRKEELKKRQAGIPTPLTKFWSAIDSLQQMKLGDKKVVTTKQQGEINKYANQIKVAIRQIADTLATAYTVAKTIQAVVKDVDLVICGKQAIDGDTAQVGPGVATRLGIPQLTYVSKIKEINLEKKKIIVERLLEYGREVVESSLPALLTVVKDINEPRLPSLLGIKKAAKAQIPTLTAKDVGADENRIGLKGSPTWVTKVFSPEARGGSGEILKGELPEVVPLLVNKLMDTKSIK